MRSNVLCDGGIFKITKKMLKIELKLPASSSVVSEFVSDRHIQLSAAVLQNFLLQVPGPGDERETPRGTNNRCRVSDHDHDVSDN